MYFQIEESDDDSGGCMEGKYAFKKRSEFFFIDLHFLKIK